MSNSLGVELEIRQGTLTIGTTAIEAKVSTTRLSGREFLTIHNDGPRKVFYGPSTVSVSSGTPIFKDQLATIPIEDDMPLYLISTENCTVRVTEYA